MIAAVAGVALAGPLADAVALHLGRDGRVVDSATLTPLYEAACAGGAEVACHWRSWDDWGRLKADVAARLAEPACTNGAGAVRWDACTALALAVGRSPPGWPGYDPNRAEGLLRDACAAGDARACRECRSFADDGALGACADAAAVPPVERGTCADGWVAACEPAAATGEVVALELLCTARGGSWCDVLGARRIDLPVPVREAPPSEQWVTPSGFLLGWSGPVRSDRALVPYTAVRSVDLQVRPSRDEWLELTLADRSVSLPHGCDGVVAALARLGGVPVWARDERGGPARSVCTELARSTFPYVGGELEVGAVDHEDQAQTTEIHDHLAEAAGGLFGCAVGTSPSSPVVVSVVRARSGPPKKVSIASSSGVATLDACVAEWLGSTPLGEVAVPARFTVQVALDW